MTATPWLAALVTAATLIGVAVGRYPWLRMNRATIALAGAVVLVAIGAISPAEAAAAIDLPTLGLLLGMMILNANFRLSGFFRLAGAWMCRHARTPRGLLGVVIAVSGLLSALFLNDTIVLMFTPLVLEITARLRRNPLPYLIGLVAAANIGSVATITGNPQNMLIGISSGIGFNRFAAALAPVALVGLGVAWLVIVGLYREEFRRGGFDPATGAALAVRPLRPVLAKSLVAAGLMLLALVSGVAPSLAALGAATLLLVTRRLKPERVFREVDFALLIFFSGLFVVTAALEPTGISGRLLEAVRPLAERGVAPLAAVGLVLSNLVSNVPAVLLLRPFIPAFPDPETAWLTLAMATTLAGNLTLLGSVANLIVAEQAMSHGVRLGFFEYLRAGLPITLLTLVVGIAWLTRVG